MIWRIISIIDTSNNNIGSINPFKYKSYYYDTETGWYYLNSRYYNPLIGRFLTTDDIYFLGNADLQNSYNMFCYSLNNPINYVDFSGNAPQLYLNSVVFANSYGQTVNNFVDTVNSLKTIITGLCVQLPVYLIQIRTATKAFITILKTAIKTTFAIILSVALILAAIGTLVYAIKKVYDLSLDLSLLIENIKTKGQIDKKDCRDHSVYVLDRSNFFIDVYYVGRTNDPYRRMNEHKRSGLLEEFQHFKVVITNLQLDEARIIEQALITFYFSIKLKNSINSISQKNWKNFAKTAKDLLTLGSGLID